MRPKSLMLLALALGCGLIASIGISQVMDRKGGAVVETSPIYVASIDIGVGDAITPEMVKIEDWPKAKIPPGAVRKLEELEGQRPKVKLFAENPILEQMLGGGGIPARTIPMGMRAISVKLGPNAVGAELLTPGDRVDVQLSVKPSEKTGIRQSRTKVILSNVRVWAIDQTIDRETDGGDAHIAKIVSLLVSTDQADRLDLAQKLGKIRLTLRHPDDTSETVSSGVTVADLFGNSVDDKKSTGTGKKPSLLSKMTQMLQPKSILKSKVDWTMEVIEGDQVRRLSFDKNGKVLEREERKSEQPFVLPESAPGVKGDGEPSGSQAGKKGIEDFLSSSIK